MLRFLKWVGYVVGGVVITMSILIGGLYGRGTSILNKQWDVAGADIPVPTDSAAIARGHRIATSRGCLNCHNALAQGGVFVDDPLLGRVVAPNIARLAREYSTAQFDGAVRRGVRPSGTGVAIMPSQMFYSLTDGDLGDLIAFLRDLTPQKDTLPATDVRIMGRIGLATGKFHLAPQIIQQGYNGQRPSLPAHGDTLAQGRYIAQTSCSECHGLDLRGGNVGPELLTPSLVAVSAYSREQFANLMRNGEPAGGRKLTLMAEVARSRFASFNDDEISALHSDLQTLR